MLEKNEKIKIQKDINYTLKKLNQSIQSLIELLPNDKEVIQLKKQSEKIHNKLYATPEQAKPYSVAITKDNLKAFENFKKNYHFKTDQAINVLLNFTKSLNAKKLGVEKTNAALRIKPSTLDTMKNKCNEFNCSITSLMNSMFENSKWIKLTKITEEYSKKFEFDQELLNDYQTNSNSKEKSRGR